MRSVSSWTRGRRTVERSRRMKRPLLKVSIHVMLLALFLLLNTSEASPVRDGIPGEEAAIWQNAALQSFYGPWSNLQKANGENADYNDYQEHIQDFEPGPEDEPSDESEEPEGEAADFQSNYGETGGDNFNIAFEPSPVDQSAGNQDDGDQIVGADEPESQEFEGNVKWTSAET